MVISIAVNVQTDMGAFGTCQRDATIFAYYLEKPSPSITPSLGSNFQDAKAQRADARHRDWAAYISSRSDRVGTLSSIPVPILVLNLITFTSVLHRLL
jgi:hypothetical protein